MSQLLLGGRLQLFAVEILELLKSVLTYRLHPCEVPLQPSSAHFPRMEMMTAILSPVMQ